jgi:hypothetical protein
MNETNQDPNSNAAFSQTSGAQSNPFTGELKGEFSSDFGTNTNAVSQIFKSGGFAAENKSRLILLGVLALAILAGAFFYLSEPMEGDSTGDEVATDENATGDEEAKDDATATEGAEEAKKEETAVTDAAATDAAAANTGAFAISAPADGAQQEYDETSGPSEFSWTGAADEIVFSRSKSMNPTVRSVKLNGASTFLFENPYPGTWYWQLKNASGTSEVRSFTIQAPPKRSFPITSPTPGQALTANGGVVSWQPAEKVARYAVELAPQGSGFASPAYRFGTSGTSVAIQGVNPGAYDVRVGAFSEVSGRWEWQVVQGVTVQ